MENIIIVKPGMDPVIYFRHVCNHCRAILDIKISILEFKCPCCLNDDVCDQNPETMIKKYDAVETSPRLLTKSLSKKISKKKI